MHYIQKHILDKLRMTSSLRYSDIQPIDIESSHFKYHLNQLMKDGMVQQTSRGVYALTSVGESRVDKISSNRVVPYESPKVITYCLLQDANNYYLYRKPKQPYLNLLNLIGGKVHVGETSLQAAKRELKEKLNLIVEDSQLYDVGTAEIIIKQDNKIYTHVVAYVFNVEINNILESKNIIPVPKNKIYSESDLAPDALQLISAITSNTNPFKLIIEANYDL